MDGEGRFVEMSETKTFEKFELSDSVDEREFSFTKFNFPEPVGVVWDKPTPRYVWWLIAVGCCGTIAVICRVYVHRLKRSVRHPIH